MRLRVLDQYPLRCAKRGCYLCRKVQPRHRLKELPDAQRVAEHEKVIATGVEVDREGEIVLCQSCIGAMANLLGFLVPVQVETLEHRARVLQESNDGLLEVAGRHNRLLAALAETGLESIGGVELRLEDDDVEAVKA